MQTSESRKLSDEQNQQVILRLKDCSRTRHRLCFSYDVNDLCFHDSYWYNTVDFYQLEKKFGQLAMERLYFHMLSLEAMKAVCLRPNVFDLGPFSHHYTKDFEQYWLTADDNIYSKWRYENNIRDYAGPKIVFDGMNDGKVCLDRIENQPGKTEILVCSGGGKDSLSVFKILDRANLSYSSYSYAGTAYGNIDKQFELVEGMLQHAQPVKIHRIYGYSDYLSTPVASLYPEFGASHIQKYEDYIPPPSSIFGLLPLMLAHGYTDIVVGNERYADETNLLNHTGEQFNYQWIKTMEHDRFTLDYLRKELVSNVSYYSMLKPIYDLVTFEIVRQNGHALSDTHSCNLGKPWCERCAKCAYVYLCSAAYLPEEQVKQTFKTNPLDIEENLIWYRQMLGLSDYQAFEAVGGVEETCLAFEICRCRGIQGCAVDMFAREVSPMDYLAIVNKYTQVNTNYDQMPTKIADKVLPIVQTAAESARQRLTEILLQKR